jgi:hypothetical protein
MTERERGGTTGEGKTAEGPTGAAERTLRHDAAADREYTTEERTRSLDRESPPGAPAPAPGDDPRARAVERHGAPGAQGTDLDAARELASRDLEEGAIRRDEARDRDPPRRG